MADITVTILDGQLGLVNSVGQNAIVHAGVCAAGTPNAIYGLGDIPTASSTLGPGTLTENVADTIAVAGSCFACPVNPSVAGSVGSTTQVGTGAGTVTGSAGPAYQILVKISTGGVLGTMAAEFQRQRRRLLGSRPEHGKLLVLSRTRDAHDAHVRGADVHCRGGLDNHHGGRDLAVWDRHRHLGQRWPQARWTPTTSWSRS